MLPALRQRDASIGFGERRRRPIEPPRHADIARPRRARGRISPMKLPPPLVFLIDTAADERYCQQARGRTVFAIPRPRAGFITRHRRMPAAGDISY